MTNLSNFQWVWYVQLYFVFKYDLLNRIFECINYFFSFVKTKVFILYSYAAICIFAVAAYLQRFMLLDIKKSK